MDEPAAQAAPTWDMTISRQEFMRLLPGAVGQQRFRVSEQGIASEVAAPGWCIELAPLEDLRIGLLVLPRHRVRIRFSGFSPDQTDAFLKRFELYFRRGGG